MSDSSKPPIVNPPSSTRTLRRLYLTLFLRGRTSRGLQKQGAPKSVWQKLLLSLLFYAIFGTVALSFLGKTVFMLSLQLHALTFVFLGMFVASSAGEVLFNQEEADILMHRPVTARALLWAKISVMVQVSLWLAGALNLAGFIVGTYMSDGGWLFPVAHAISTIMEALFCTGFVVVVYQLCLRWFGRERLEGLMTTTQVIVAIVVVTGGQFFPQLIGRGGSRMELSLDRWWVALLPPAWFASFDDAVAGHGTNVSWLVAGIGFVITGIVLWLAFGKLARDYELGLQTLSERSAPRASSKGTGQRRWVDVLVHAPPLSWWLRDSVARASFLLTAAYLMRDRDVKLRIYPGLAPILAMPLVFLLQDRGGRAPNGFGGFGVAFSGAYLGLIPMLALNMLQFSQHWQASDLFRAAPMIGPVQLCHGARRAVLVFLTLPIVLLCVAATWFLRGNSAQLVLLLPGIIALPVYSLIPCLGGNAVPLSQPTEEAKSVGRGLQMMVVMFASFAMAGISVWAHKAGFFLWFLAVEIVMVAVVYTGMRLSLGSVRWKSME